MTRPITQSNCWSWSVGKIAWSDWLFWIDELFWVSGWREDVMCVMMVYDFGVCRLIGVPLSAHMTGCASRSHVPLTPLTPATRWPSYFCRIMTASNLKKVYRLTICQFCWSLSLLLHWVVFTCMSIYGIFWSFWVHFSVTNWFDYNGENICKHLSSPKHVSGASPLDRSFVDPRWNV